MKYNTFGVFFRTLRQHDREGCAVAQRSLLVPVDRLPGGDRLHCDPDDLLRWRVGHLWGYHLIRMTSIFRRDKPDSSIIETKTL